VTYRIKRGDIYLASYHFPHEDETIIRQRPVLVLQCDDDNENPHYPLVIVAPVTTKKIERIYEQDVFLRKGEGGLDEDSKVLLGVMQAVTKTSLVNRIGSLSHRTMEVINLKLLRLLGFL